jgi:hypothetical protein
VRGSGHGRKVPRPRGPAQYRFRYSPDGSAPRSS